MEILASNWKDTQVGALNNLPSNSIKKLTFFTLARTFSPTKVNQYLKKLKE